VPRAGCERAAAVDRVLLGAPVVATERTAIRAYHDSILNTLGNHQ
jgi:hypothetical protein